MTSGRLWEIPLTPSKSVSFIVQDNQLTEPEWDRFMLILEAMKPAIVPGAEPQNLTSK